MINSSDSDPTPPVELTTHSDGRQRELCARILIPSTLEKVWALLTDYDHLAQHIPNLASSRRIPHPNGKIRLEQIGTQQFFRLNFSARVVLDMEEEYPHTLHFAMVEGDFKAFQGSWKLNTLDVEGQPYTHLSYCLTILPKMGLPVQVIENCLGKDLTANLMAIRQRVLELNPA
jgi:ribosome-associated toxin RatA of RatAB toxin-antitoxin module